MSRTIPRLAGHARLLAFSMLAALVTATGSYAKDTANVQAAQKGVTVAHVSTKGLNLLSAPGKGTPTVRVTSMGRGSWICSPAGFGRRARCYRN